MRELEAEREARVAELENLYRAFVDSCENNTEFYWVDAIEGRIKELGGEWPVR